MVIGGSLMYLILAYYLLAVYILACTLALSKSRLCSVAVIISYALFIILLACHCELLSGSRVRLSVIMIIVRPYWPVTYDRCVMEKYLFHFQFFVDNCFIYLSVLRFFFVSYL